MIIESISTKRAVIVTNRGPVEYYLDQHKTLKHRRGAGGVVTDTSSVARQPDLTRSKGSHIDPSKPEISLSC